MAPSVFAASFSAHPSAAVRQRAASAGAKRVRAGATEGGKWWVPLLEWSGRPDYIEAAAPMTATEEAARRPSSFVGGLTEEKARELHSRMVETESFHDTMYHSTIASRLARSA